MASLPYPRTPLRRYGHPAHTTHPSCLQKWYGHPIPIPPTHTTNGKKLSNNQHIRQPSTTLRPPPPAIHPPWQIHHRPFRRCRQRVAAPRAETLRVRVRHNPRSRPLQLPSAWRRVPARRAILPATMPSPPRTPPPRPLRHARLCRPASCQHRDGSTRPALRLFRAAPPRHPRPRHLRRPPSRRQRRDPPPQPRTRHRPARTARHTTAQRPHHPPSPFPQSPADRTVSRRPRRELRHRFNQPP